MGGGLGAMLGFLMTKLFCIVLLSINILPFCIAQSVVDETDNQSEHLSRFRLISGCSISKDGASPFLNFNFHYSGFERNSKNFQINFSFEPGFNWLFSDSRSYFQPYIKLAPEFGFNNNIFLNINVGAAYYSYSEGQTVVPFYGFSGNYLFHLNNSFSIELESGVNSTLLTYKPYTFFYFAIAVALI
jgi:hypothetical protein